MPIRRCAGNPSDLALAKQRQTVHFRVRFPRVADRSIKDRQLERLTFFSYYLVECECLQLLGPHCKVQNQAVFPREKPPRSTAGGFTFVP